MKLLCIILLLSGLHQDVTPLWTDSVKQGVCPCQNMPWCVWSMPTTYPQMHWEIGNTMCEKKKICKAGMVTEAGTNQSCHINTHQCPLCIDSAGLSDAVIWQRDNRYVQISAQKSRILLFTNLAYMHAHTHTYTHTNTNTHTDTKV